MARNRKSDSSGGAVARTTGLQDVTKLSSAQLARMEAEGYLVRKQGSLDELGSTGLARTGKTGLVVEEFLRDLSGVRALRIYREMRDNDPIVGAMLFAIEMMIRNVTWRVEGPEEEHVDFVTSCMEDMSHSWEDFIAEVLSMLPYGFSWHEVVYKRRSGESRDPKRNSRYDDGRIGWRKIPIRAQDTLQDWEWDDEGGIQAFNQVAPPDYNPITIPISRSLLFRFGIHKGNPEGRSVLRNAYRPWYFKRRMEEIEGIGVERDLAGLPVIYRDAGMAEKWDAELKKILRNVRRDEQEGLLLPLVYDEQGRELLKFELLSSAGSRQMDVGKIVDRYNKTILMTCLADFIMLGQSGVGSWALSSSKTELFATALGAVLKAIASVINRYGIPRLLAINQMKYKEPPYLVPSDLETPDLKELGAFITSLAGAGAPIFPDDDLENYLREAANLPLKPEEREGKQPIPQPKPKQKPPTGEEEPELPESMQQPKGGKPAQAKKRSLGPFKRLATRLGL